MNIIDLVDKYGIDAKYYHWLCSSFKKSKCKQEYKIIEAPQPGEFYGCTFYFGLVCNNHTTQKCNYNQIFVRK